MKETKIFEIWLFLAILGDFWLFPKMSNFLKIYFLLWGPTRVGIRSVAITSQKLTIFGNFGRFLAISENVHKIKFGDFLMVYSPELKARFYLIWGQSWLFLALSGNFWLFLKMYTSKMGKLSFCPS